MVSLSLSLIRYTLFWFLALSLSSAWASNYGITYQGRIVDPSGQPLVAENVQFLLWIGAGNEETQSQCLLYSERTTLNMSNQSGGFALILGRGNRNDGGTTPLKKLFAPNLTYQDSSQCRGGFKKTSDNKLFLNVSFDPGSGPQYLAPMEITTTPYALDTVHVAGVPSEQILRVETSEGAFPVSYDNYSLNVANFKDLVDLINGTSIKYARFGSATEGDLNTSGNISAAGNIDSGSMSTRSLILSSSTAQDAPKINISAPSALATTYALSLPLSRGLDKHVLTSDGNGGTRWDTPFVSSVVTGTGLSGGPITSAGTISLANTTVQPGNYGEAYKVAGFSVDEQGRLTEAHNVDIPTADATKKGLLSAADWNTFNGKQAAGNFISALTGDVIATAIIPGSVIASLKEVGFAGTYTKVTTDSKGRVTGGTTLGTADIPNLDWNKITSGKPTTLAGYGITDSAPLASPTFTGNVNFPGTGIWTSAGNVGIGTTNPAALLHIAADQDGAFGNGPSIFVENPDGNGAGGSAAFRLARAGATKWALVNDVDGNATDNLTVWGQGGVKAITVQSVTGNVGIGTQSPNTKLDVVGSVVSRIYNNGSSVNFDFSKANNQYTSADCGAYTLQNMEDGGIYQIIVKGITSSTCSFSHSGLTMRMPTNHGATTQGAHTIYSFMRAGPDVYVSWVPGY